jgi:hypothetical protein
MSVTFSIGSRVAADPGCPDTFLNLANRNAADLLAWLGLPSAELYGSLPGRELAALCRRRLWPEKRNVDAERAEERIGRSVFLGLEVEAQRADSCEAAQDALLAPTTRSVSPPETPTRSLPASAAPMPGAGP